MSKLLEFVPARATLALLCLLLAGALAYDISTRPLQRKYMVAKAIRSVVIVGCEAAHGTGFVASRRGHIVTAAHVIANCRGKIAVQYFGNLKLYRAALLKTVPDYDVAILQVPQPPPVPALEFNVAGAYPGESLTLIGHPLDKMWTVSSGIMSAFRISSMGTLNQMTAPVIPGNSGCPVLNEEGQVIGMGVQYHPRTFLISWYVPAAQIKPFLDNYTRG